MMTAIAPQPVPSWEDQIVPTLKKRLETESAYLHDRLSSSSIPTIRDFPPSFTATRTRTKSTPFGANIQSSTRTSIDKSRQIQPIASSSSSRANSASPTKSPNSPPDIASFIPSRIPSRPRSKSQLAPRPSITSNNSHPPLPPSQIPVLKGRSGRPGSSGGLLSNGTEEDSGQIRGRGSLELRSDFREGFIKHELPPFKVERDEALRIAEWGYDFKANEDGSRRSGDGERDDVDEERTGFGIEDVDRGGEKRKRSITMRNGPDDLRKSIQRPSTANSSAVNRNGQTNGMSRSATSSVGLGHPSSSRLASSTSRSASSRQNPTSANSFAQTPRSASLNLISSPSAPASRLGIAAHLVPPESSYTPPKGSNWDDVLLPAVAKKLGIGGGTVEEEGGEEDLAVEWDKDGTPVKWVKKSPMMGSNGGKAGFGDVDRSGSVSPSPNQNLQPDPIGSITQKSSQKSLRQKLSQSNLSPIRLPSGSPSDLPGPSSPAPFTNFTPYDPSRNPLQPESKGPSRKPSMLRKGLSSVGSRQPSQQSLRGGTRTGGGGGDEGTFQNPRSAPPPIGGPVRNQGGVGRAETWEMKGMNGNEDFSGQGDASGGRKNGKKHEDEVGKGCGCVIM